MTGEEKVADFAREQLGRYSALECAEKSRTEAIYHERLMHVTGWVLYIATMVRTAAA